MVSNKYATAIIEYVESKKGLQYDYADTYNVLLSDYLHSHRYRGINAPVKLFMYILKGFFSYAKGRFYILDIETGYAVQQTKTEVFNALEHIWEWHFNFVKNRHIYHLHVNVATCDKDYMTLQNTTLHIRITSAVCIVKLKSNVGIKNLLGTTAWQRRQNIHYMLMYNPVETSVAYPKIWSIHKSTWVNSNRIENSVIMPSISSQQLDKQTDKQTIGSKAQYSFKTMVIDSLKNDIDLWKYIVNIMIVSMYKNEFHQLRHRNIVMSNDSFIVRTFAAIFPMHIQWIDLCDEHFRFLCDKKLKTELSRSYTPSVTALHVSDEVWFKWLKNNRHKIALSLFTQNKITRNIMGVPCARRRSNQFTYVWVISEKVINSMTSLFSKTKYFNRCYFIPCSHAYFEPVPKHQVCAMIKDSNYINSFVKMFSDEAKDFNINFTTAAPVIQATRKFKCK